MTKTGDLSCLYCDLFEKNILPCPFIEAADSAISLQAQQNRYYRTQKRLLWGSSCKEMGTIKYDKGDDSAYGTDKRAGTKDTKSA